MPIEVTEKMELCRLEEYQWEMTEDWEIPMPGELRVMRAKTITNFLSAFSFSNKHR
jgi:hypothetical protein